MNTAHGLMEQLQREGASHFAHTGLARNHASVTRVVRRQRAARATVLSVAGVAVVGAAAVGVSHYGTNTVTPGIGSTEPTGAPTQSASATPVPLVSIAVGREQPVEEIARLLATAFGTREDEAYGAITAALPPEAGGYAEGWILAGVYSVDPNRGLQAAADQLVSMSTLKLESLGVPRDKWAQTVILASILQQEAPAAYADQTGVARVLLNRLDADMPLQVDSPTAYVLRIAAELTANERDLDSPYNTYKYEGLPPSAIGAFTPEALEAATDPADGDWMFFLRKRDGNVVLSRNLPEHLAAVEAEYPDGYYSTE